MNLHEVFEFLLNFDEKIPHTFLLWLDKYPKLEQDSFVCIIQNAKNYKLKSKLRNKKFTHKTTHKNGCMCEHYYNILLNMVQFSFSNVGKCLDQRTYEKVETITEEMTTYSETVCAPLLFNEIPHIKTTKLKTIRFREFVKYVIKPGTLTVYTLLTLLKKDDFNLYTLTSYLDVIEIAMIFVLVNGVFTSRFIEKFLPNYCRTLRFVDNSTVVDVNRDILTDIYEKFYNINIRTQFPSVNFISMGLRPIRMCGKIPSQSETIQLGYVGERFVMHAINGKLHIMNDFGEYLGVYSQYVKYPFEEESDFIFECVKTRRGCFIVDVYMSNKILLYHDSPRARADILSKVSINDDVDIKIAPLISTNNILQFLDIGQDILKHGPNNLLYDSLIFRCNNFNTILRYRIKKPQLVFEPCGTIRTESVSENCEYSSRYSGYFALKADKNSYTINVWDKCVFVVVGRFLLPVSFFDNKKSNFIVKVYFNFLVGTKLEGVVAVVPKKYKSMYNCLSMEDLVKIK